MGRPRRCTGGAGVQPLPRTPNPARAGQPTSHPSGPPRSRCRVHPRAWKAGIGDGGEPDVRKVASKHGVPPSRTSSLGGDGTRWQQRGGPGGGGARPRRRLGPRGGRRPGPRPPPAPLGPNRRGALVSPPPVGPGSSLRPPPCAPRPFLGPRPRPHGSRPCTGSRRPPGRCAPPSRAEPSPPAATPRRHPSPGVASSFRPQCGRASIARRFDCLFLSLFSLLGGEPLVGRDVVPAHFCALMPPYQVWHMLDRTLKTFVKRVNKKNAHCWDVFSHVVTQGTVRRDCHRL